MLKFIQAALTPSGSDSVRITKQASEYADLEDLPTAVVIPSLGGCAVPIGRDARRRFASLGNTPQE